MASMRAVFDAAAVFRNRGRDTFHKDRGQFGVRCLFVTVHEPRLASHVLDQHRRQPTLDPDWRLLHHGPQSTNSRLYDGSGGSAKRSLAVPAPGWFCRPIIADSPTAS